MIAGHLPLSIVETFRNGSSSKDDIKAAGVEVFKFLLTKGKRQELSLDELRLQKFKIICGKGKLHPERLPPTQGSLEQQKCMLSGCIGNAKSGIPSPSAIFLGSAGRK